mmetsp:Transcript_10776/g.15206  ORF Transcript_10776/g.15206 Transcript_10776/m.15206 type:complete len:208 (+) Transcript_10776:385-1008(+)
MTVIKGTVSNLVGIIDCLIDIINGMAVLITNTDFPFTLLTLFHQVKHNNRSSVSLKKVFKMMLCGLVRWINTIELNWWLGHGDTTFLCPVRRNRSPHLQEGRKGSGRRRARLVVNYLFMLYIIGYLASVTYTALQISSSRKVTRPTSQKYQIEGSTVIIEFPLNKGAVDDGHHPVITCERVATFIELSCQKVIPSIHILYRWWWKGL